jgi:hypothetical protein
MKEIIDVLASYHRSISLITNGYNLFGLPKAYLNKISYLVLDDHGPNKAHIVDCKNYLKPFYKGEVKRVGRYYHRNCMEAKRHPKNVGICTASCRVPQALSLLRDTIYPCPAMEFIEMMDKHTKITDSLKEAGWTLRNPDIHTVLRNWRDTIPFYVWDQCRNNCWYPHIEYGREARITLKPNDVIKKRSNP